MRFLGEIEAKADNKGRVFIPAAYRKQLEKEDESSLVMRVDSISRCAKFYPLSVWEKMDEEFRSKLNLWDKNDQKLYRQFTAKVEQMDMDSSGRILLQKKHCETLGIEDTVLFIGVGDHFEVWNKCVYDDSLLDDEDFEKALQEKMGNPSA